MQNFNKLILNKYYAIPIKIIRDNIGEYEILFEIADSITTLIYQKRIWWFDNLWSMLWIFVWISLIILFVSIEGL